MHINELLPAQLVNLEMVVENAHYEIVTRVVGSNDNAVLVEPIEYKNKIIQIDRKSAKNIVFNLYGSTPDDKRVCWRNISLELKQYKSQHYYGIHAKSYNCDGVDADRRAFERLRVDDLNVSVVIPGVLSFEAPVYDISCDGIAFVYEDVEIPRTEIIVKLSDKIKSEQYEFKLKANLVRRREYGSDFVYGCRLHNTDRKFLSYLFLKALMIHNSDEEVEVLESITK